MSLATSPWCTTPSRWSVLHIVLGSCLLIGVRAIVNRNQALDEFDSFNPNFVAPQLTPPQFLIISSPQQGKIAYTPLRNFKSTTGRTYALIDSGLHSPKGIALDRERGALYIADEGAQKIFRYHVYVQDNNVLTTDGLQITILQGVPVSWVAVDYTGNVFYSDPGAKAIVKIPYSTIISLAEGSYRAVDLSFISEGQLVHEAVSLRQQEMNGTADATPTDMPAMSTDVFKLYEGDLNSHVSHPGGLATDGFNLYWTNMQNGSAAGSAVRGFSDPELPLGASSSSSFPALALSNETEEAFGIAKATTILVFSSNSSGIGSVYGLFEKTGQVHTFSSDLAEPRGLVWDGDQTVYVADQAMNGVWSFPVGRLVDNTPLTKSAVLNGAYGVALISQRDKAWTIKAGAFRLHSSGWLCSVLALAAVWMRLGA